MPIARIMIVEDEQITAADLEASLEDLGYAVTAIASSGKQAIRSAETTLPDLVLMDIRIKGEMDGVDAARQIRQRFDIPVIYLTAHADDETLERAKSAEPLGYIVKPFQESELRAAIQMALHKDKADKKAKGREEHLAATLGHLSRADDAGRIWRELMAINPAYSAPDHIARLPFQNPKDAGKFTEGLRKAGLP